MASLCGNGRLDGDDEECDEGPDNSDTLPDACRTDCVDYWCGDGVVDSDEECDDGNLVDGDGCESDCTLPEGTCGDGVVDPEEECDDGRLNSDTVPDRCRLDCTEPFCGDDVVDSGHGETCEPPGTLLCDDECTLRFLPGLVRARNATPGGSVAGCQEAMLRVGLRVFARYRARLARCVALVDRCVLTEDDGRCLDRAVRVCGAAAAVAAPLHDGAVARAAARCRVAGDPALADLLDPANGLGLARLAAMCRLAGPAPPRLEDLLGRAYDQVRCTAERAVARAVPRAYELLWEAVDDPATAFPCVEEPEVE